MNQSISKLTILLLVVLALAGVYTVQKNRTTAQDTSKGASTSDEQTEEEVHYHAGFKIFQNNEQMDFTDISYMWLEPCEAHSDDEEETNDAQDTEFIHLHDSVGDVIHIHAAGATWGNVFEYLRLQDIDPSRITAYANGEIVADPLQKSVEPYQSLIFLIGENPTIVPSELSNYITKEYVMDVESNGENCGN